MLVKVAWLVVFLSCCLAEDERLIKSAANLHGKRGKLRFVNGNGAPQYLGNNFQNYIKITNQRLNEAILKVYEKKDISKDDNYLLPLPVPIPPSLLTTNTNDDANDKNENDHEAPLTENEIISMIISLGNDSSTSYKTTNRGYVNAARRNLMSNTFVQIVTVKDGQSYGIDGSNVGQTSSMWSTTDYENGITVEFELDSSSGLYLLKTDLTDGSSTVTYCICGYSDNDVRADTLYTAAIDPSLTEEHDVWQYTRWDVVMYSNIVTGAPQDEYVLKARSRYGAPLETSYMKISNSGKLKCDAKPSSAKIVHFTFE